ncbi:MAG TPA: ComF family protein [Verrucomicrobiae bacterium]
MFSIALTFALKPVSGAAVPAIAHSIRTWLNAGLGFVYPEVCQICGKARATPAECFVCAGCRARIRLIQPPFCERCGMPFQGQITTRFECENCRDAGLQFQYARAAVVAGEQVLELVHRYKYHRAFWCEPLLADFLIRAAGPELKQQHWDLIVPVPLYPARQREREFNQAERLGRRLAAATGIQLDTRLLKRVRATETQTRLSREERRRNMHNAFAVNPRRSLSGERIVLIDDVFTTGATTSACSRVLRAAGAGALCVWTVARGI